MGGGGGHSARLEILGHIDTGLELVQLRKIGQKRCIRIVIYWMNCNLSSVFDIINTNTICLSIM